MNHERETKPAVALRLSLEQPVACETGTGEPHPSAPNTPESSISKAPRAAAARLRERCREPQGKSGVMPARSLLPLAGRGRCGGPDTNDLQDAFFVLRAVVVNLSAVM